MKIIIVFWLAVYTVQGFHNENSDVNEFLNDPQAFGIKGGKKTIIEKRPYTVAINNPNGKFLGNGALVANNWVITAASNVNRREPQYTRIRVGSEQGQTGGTVVNVSKIIVHPKYDHFWRNDLALIKLQNRIEINSNVKTIRLACCLPKSKVKLIISGYGNTIYKAGTEWILRSAVVPYIPHQTCKKLYKDEKAFTHLSLCASKPGVGPCPDDFGDPLVYKGKLIGIFSGSKKDCGSKQNPAVYSDLTKFKKWIHTTISNQ